MPGHRFPSFIVLVGLALGVAVGAPRSGHAHPLGNFSISQYTGIRISRDAVELRYVIDMAEIPTFQEIQDTGITAEPGHSSLAPYLARKAEALKEHLRLAVDGRVLDLRTQTRDVIFPPGAGGLPTLKLGLVYRATLPPLSAETSRLDYRDGNYPDRAGWKEIVAAVGPGVTIASASVPERDRSRELSDYPTDLLNSPPQDREARLSFLREAPLPVVARRSPPAPPSAAKVPPSQPAGERAATRPVPPPSRVAVGPVASPGSDVREPDTGLQIRPNRQTTTQNAFTELVTMKDLNIGMLLFVLAVAAALGGFHALEPGHGKTVVAAYLVGSRGTVRHAALLGLTVTASHTAGVYLLGGVTLYASRYIVPERLYPWLGVVSGLAIAVLGFTLFLRRYAAHGEHGHVHSHGGHAHPHHHDDPRSHHDHVHPAPDGAVSLPALLALGVTGGIVPCPAAVVVLLSALSLNRVGFGLLLIVAFSIGLAAVLIVIGILMVYARRLMSRFDTDGPLIRRWLPLTSSVVITIVGVLIALQALMSAGMIQIRL
jgi:ABC-type nickel/cobalt efflux system permease component RcnA